MSLSGNGNINGWRTDPMYTFREAAHLAHVSPSTVRNWLLGYTVGAREVPPLLSTPEGQGPMVSFLQLVETVVAGQFRKTARVSLDRVRRAYEVAQQRWGLQHPFAHLTLEVRGSHIVHYLRHENGGASQQALDELTQWTLPGLVLETVQQLEYELDLAARWYPVGKSVPIVVDPRVSSGAPIVVERGVTVQVIRKRFDAGQKISFIASDFKLEQNIVEEAVRYARQVAA